MSNRLAVTVRTGWATLQREWLSFRINRFLHVHALLMLAIGVLALIAPPEAGAYGGSWWLFNGTTYVASISALLLGLSSAQAEVDEFPLLFTQPIALSGWVAGKFGALLTVTFSAALLLVFPIAFAFGFSAVVFGSALGAAMVTCLWAWLGAALGLSIEDPVRGLIAALLAWFVLIFGFDLGLILLGGSSWVRANPGAWVSAMMASPMDAYRVGLLFALEGVAFSGADLHPLTRWWLRNPLLWMTLCLGGWSVLALIVALRAARQRRAR